MNSALFGLLVTTVEPVVAKALVTELQSGSLLDVAAHAVAGRLESLVQDQQRREHATKFLNTVIAAGEELGVALAGGLGPVPGTPPAPGAQPGA